MTAPPETAHIHYAAVARPRISDADLARAVSIAIDPDAPVEKLRLLLQLVVEIGK